MNPDAAATTTSHPANKLPTEKKTELFRLAIEEFSAQGFTHASLNRIIAGMGMSKSSFYHYFQNKADLFERTLDHILAPYVADLEALDFEALDTATFWPTLQSIVREQTLSANRSPEAIMISRMIYRAMDDPEERALTHDALEFSTRWLVALIRRGRALRLVRRDLPEDLLITMVMGFSTAFERWVLDHWDRLTDAERVTMAETAVDAYMRLLQPGADDQPGPGAPHVAHQSDSEEDRRHGDGIVVQDRGKV